MADEQLPFFPRQHSIGRLENMTSQDRAVGVIGALLGYIGAEAAHEAPFEKLLWPQRAYSGFTWCHVLKTALLAPGGGPVYKVALQVLDKAFCYGLLRGSGLGSMLGTTFFPQTGSKYTLRSNSSDFLTHTEPSRNCLWERVILLLPLPKVAGTSSEKAPDGEGVPRAHMAVHHIILAARDRPQGVCPALDVSTDSYRTSFRVLAGLFVSETLGVALAILIAVIWHSWLAALWVCPLGVKLLSAAAALDRDPLELQKFRKQDRVIERAQDFEFDMSPETGMFLLITGPPTLVLQFVRHFGHPRRDRFREILQLCIVVASALLFPLGLVLSVTIMPEPLQYVWLSYQMYLVLAMYISRYMWVNLWSSTEEVIARELSSSPERAYLWGERKRRTTVEARIQSTYHAKYGEALVHMRKLLARPR